MNSLRTILFGNSAQLPNTAVRTEPNIITKLNLSGLGFGFGINYHRNKPFSTLTTPMQQWIKLQQKKLSSSHWMADKLDKTIWEKIMEQSAIEQFVNISQSGHAIVVDESAPATNVSIALPSTPCNRIRHSFPMQHHCERLYYEMDHQAVNVAFDKREIMEFLNMAAGNSGSADRASDLNEQSSSGTPANISPGMPRVWSYRYMEGQSILLLDPPSRVTRHADVPVAPAVTFTAPAPATPAVPVATIDSPPDTMAPATADLPPTIATPPGLYSANFITNVNWGPTPITTGWTSPPQISPPPLSSPPPYLQMPLQQPQLLFNPPPAAPNCFYTPTVNQFNQDTFVYGSPQQQQQQQHFFREQFQDILFDGYPPQQEQNLRQQHQQGIQLQHLQGLQPLDTQLQSQHFPQQQFQHFDEQRHDRLFEGYAFQHQQHQQQYQHQQYQQYQLQQLQRQEQYLRQQNPQNQNVQLQQQQGFHIPLFQQQHQHQHNPQNQNIQLQHQQGLQIPLVQLQGHHYPQQQFPQNYPQQQDQREDEEEQQQQIQHRIAQMLAPVLLSANSPVSSDQSDQNQRAQEGSGAKCTYTESWRLQYKKTIDSFCHRLRADLQGRFGVRYIKYLFQVNEEVGSGATGTVRAIRYINRARSQFVMKEILIMRDMELLDAELNALDIMNEIKGLNLNHCNLMRLHEVLLNPESGTVQIIMPKMVFSLDTMKYNLDRRYGRAFDEAFAWYISNELMSALAYLHGEGFFHADIKPGNVLVDRNGSIKLTDFGFLGNVGVKENEFRGTFMYVAPEVADLDQMFDEKSDMWSLGILMFELVAGIPLVGGYTPREINRKSILHARQILSTRCPPILQVTGISQDYIDLVHSLLQIDPEYRPTPFALLNNTGYFHHFKIGTTHKITKKAFAKLVRKARRS